MTKYTYTFSDGSEYVHYSSSNESKIHFTPEVWKGNAAPHGQDHKTIKKLEMEYVEP